MGHIFNQINIVHINIRGLRTSKTELNLLINERQPHVITINETFLKPHVKFSIPNYTTFRKDRRNRPNGGVAILTHQQLPATEVELPKQYEGLEALTVKIHIPNWPLYISTIYNPPESQLPTNLITHLSSYHKSILLTDINAQHHILGDHPLHNNRLGLELAALLRNSNFINVTLPGPTRFPQRTGEIFSSPD
jgi:hypothetical protein